MGRTLQGFMEWNWNDVNQMVRETIVFFLQRFLNLGWRGGQKYSQNRLKSSNKWKCLEGWSLKTLRIGGVEHQNCCGLKVFVQSVVRLHKVQQQLQMWGSIMFYLLKFEHTQEGSNDFGMNLVEILLRILWRSKENDRNVRWRWAKKVSDCNGLQKFGWKSQLAKEESGDYLHPATEVISKRSD